VTNIRHPAAGLRGHLHVAAHREDGYEAMAQAMLDQALHQPGCLGAESARNPDGFGITAAYFTDEAAIAEWKQNETGASIRSRSGSNFPRGSRECRGCCARSPKCPIGRGSATAAVSAGFDAGGKLVAWHQRVVAESVAAYTSGAPDPTAPRTDRVVMKGSPIPQ
jgi:heme-degrading monooxygenase HmoA